MIDSYELMLMCNQGWRCGVASNLKSQKRFFVKGVDSHFTGIGPSRIRKLTPKEETLRDMRLKEGIKIAAKEFERITALK